MNVFDSYSFLDFCPFLAQISTGFPKAFENLQNLFEKRSIGTSPPLTSPVEFLTIQPMFCSNTDSSTTMASSQMLQKTLKSRAVMGSVYLAWHWTLPKNHCSPVWIGRGFFGAFLSLQCLVGRLLSFLVSSVCPPTVNFRLELFLWQF